MTSRIHHIIAFPVCAHFGWDESVGIEQKLDIWFGPSGSVNLIPPGACRLFFQHNNPAALRITLHLRARDTSLFSFKESNSSENCRMHLTNATFPIVNQFLCTTEPNTALIAFVWDLFGITLANSAEPPTSTSLNKKIGLQSCWQGEDQSATPREPSHLHRFANVATQSLLKRAFYD